MFEVVQLHKREPDRVMRMRVLNWNVEFYVEFFLLEGHKAARRAKKQRPAA